MSTFSEIKLFQVRPDRLAEFEEQIGKAKAGQKKLPGCISVKYMKRSYTFDGGQRRAAQRTGKNRKMCDMLFVHGI